MLLKYENTERDIDLNIYFNKEWQKVLKPLFKTEYLAALLFYIEDIYKKNATSQFPVDLKQAIFNPFILTNPEDVRVVYLHSHPHNSTQSNGIGFGTINADRNITHQKHLEFFKLNSKFEQELDESLISWLKEGVLVLNARAMMDRTIPSLHDNIFDYLYLNVFNYLSQINENLIIATNSTSCKMLVHCFESFNRNTINLHVDGYFPVRGSSIYEKINTQLTVNGSKEIRWSKIKY